jgi:hypothetical protein
MRLKPNALVYVRRSGVIVAGKNLKVTRWTFPEDLVMNMELLDPDTFTTTLAAFFKENGLHGKRVLVVLDASIVFDKQIQQDKSGSSAMQLKDFIAMMPLEPGKKAYITKKTDSAQNVYATNVELIQSFTKALNMAGAGRLVSITPAAAYGDNGVQQSLSAAVSQYINDSAVARTVTFTRTSVV